MSPSVSVAIHASQFPERVQRDLLVSLRTRRVNHKFHYDSYKQAAKWLALHEAHSPARTDPACAAIYDSAFEAAARQAGSACVHVIGLGCGGGQKEERLLRLLSGQGRRVSFTPCDVSLPLVLTAHRAAAAIIPKAQSQPAVCDLAGADDLTEFLDGGMNRQAERLVTFFGMIPNFEPSVILPRLAGFLRPQDWLLFSANLAPGPDYLAGVCRVLPGYDNALTRDWLLTFLFDLGVEAKDGELSFAIEDGEEGLARIAADFEFSRNRTVRVAGTEFDFCAGEVVRLFFSYRYTPARVATMLRRYRIDMDQQWVTPSEEEGVFLCRTERS